MYLPIVMFGYAGILCLVLAGCVVVSRTLPALQGIRELRWAVAAAIASVVLVGLRPWISAFSSVLLGNAALFAYFLLVYWTVARILGTRARALPWLIGISSVALLPLAFYTFLRPNIVFRILLSGGVAAAIAATLAAMLFRQKAPGLKSAAAALAWAQVLAALLYLARSAASLLHPPIHFVSGSWTQTALTYGQMLARLATCCGVVWLAVCVYRTDLEKRAMSDSLTGLLNRRAFDELLSREMRRHRFTGASLSLILVDIDRFKDVNDTYGHNEGDAVIRQTGETLRIGIRPSDSLARYGGEEFAVLLPDANSELAVAIAERLRTEIEQTPIGPERIRITASMGVAESRPLESPLDFLRRCDQALYRSKQTGRNGVSASINSPRPAVPSA
jgi:diguanylate cyclase (GGDEF)-like protein